MPGPGCGRHEGSEPVASAPPDPATIKSSNPARAPQRCQSCIDQHRSVIDEQRARKLGRLPPSIHGRAFAVGGKEAQSMGQIFDALRHAVLRQIGWGCNDHQRVWRSLRNPQVARALIPWLAHADGGSTPSSSAKRAMRSVECRRKLRRLYF